MVYTATFDQQSNRADFVFQITATDMDTGELVDFTDADVSCTIQDKNGTALLTLAIDSGISLIDANMLEFWFSKLDIGNLNGHYKIGCVYEKDSLTTQLFIGTVSFYDGIATV